MAVFEEPVLFWSVLFPQAVLSNRLCCSWSLAAYGRIVQTGGVELEPTAPMPVSLVPVVTLKSAPVPSAVLLLR